MNEFENMGEQEARLLVLEADLIRRRADLEALQILVFDWLEKQGAKYQNAAGAVVSVEEHNNAVSDRLLRELLKHLADGDANRASKISRILEQAEKDNET